MENRYNKNKQLLNLNEKNEEIRKKIKNIMKAKGDKQKTLFEEKAKLSELQTSKHTKTHKKKI